MAGGSYTGSGIGPGFMQGLFGGFEHVARIRGMQQENEQRQVALDTQRKVREAMESGQGGQDNGLTYAPVDRTIPADTGIPDGTPTTRGPVELTDFPDPATKVISATPGRTSERRGDERPWPVTADQGSDRRSPGALDAPPPPKPPAGQSNGAWTWDPASGIHRLRPGEAGTGWTPDTGLVRQEGVTPPAPVRAAPAAPARTSRDEGDTADLQTPARSPNPALYAPPPAALATGPVQGPPMTAPGIPGQRAPMPAPLPPPGPGQSPDLGALPAGPAAENLRPDISAPGSMSVQQLDAALQNPNLTPSVRDRLQEIRNQKAAAPVPAPVNPPGTIASPTFTAPPRQPVGNAAQIPGMAAQGRSVGGKILDAVSTGLRAINPISPAHGETLPQAQRDEGAIGGPTAVPATPSTTVAPGQRGPTQVSEKPPDFVRPTFNPKPYGYLASKSPQDRALVDRIAEEEHINPSRLALHWWLESGLASKPAKPVGDAGERGVMQMLPGTQKGIDPKMELDPNKLEDSLRMGAREIYKQDLAFGKDTPGSIVAYQGGPGTATAFAQNAARAARDHPNGTRYLEKAFPGERISQDGFQEGMEVDARGLIRAGIEQGPDGFLHLLAQTGAPNAPMGDKWRAAEAAMVSYAAMRGDTAGMAHARDFALQMSQQGTTTSLINAYKALQAGDGATAAQQLARAHAFFPDESMGAFGVDKKGQVWGQRFDEHDPSRSLGQPFKVTPESLQTMLIQTRDPNKFLAMVQAQQKLVSENRYRTQHGNYLESLPGTREAILQERMASAERIAAANRQSREDIAAARLERGGDQSAKNDAIIKEISTGGDSGAGLYSNITDPALRGAAAGIHSDLRHNETHMPPDMAHDYAEGVARGRYLLRPGTDGNYGIYARGSQRALAIVSQRAGERMERLLHPETPPRPGTGAVNTDSSAVPATVH